VKKDQRCCGPAVLHETHDPNALPSFRARVDRLLRLTLFHNASLNRQSAEKQTARWQIFYFLCLHFNDARSVYSSITKFTQWLGGHD
jgi:hypothetical protein